MIPCAIEFNDRRILLKSKFPAITPGILAVAGIPVDCKGVAVAELGVLDVVCGVDELLLLLLPGLF